MVTTNIEFVRGVLSALTVMFGPGNTPRLVLACAGAADEHWQVYHPDYPDMPHSVITGNSFEMHPDYSGL